VKTDRVVWGAAAIGEVIGRTARQTHWLLEQGAIQAARKTSPEKKKSKWHASVAGLRRQFCPEDAEGDGAEV
jgi:hypothetical protein